MADWSTVSQQASLAQANLAQAVMKARVLASGKVEGEDAPAALLTTFTTAFDTLRVELSDIIQAMDTARDA